MLVLISGDSASSGLAKSHEPGGRTGAASTTRRTSGTGAPAFCTWPNSTKCVRDGAPAAHVSVGAAEHANVSARSAGINNERRGIDNIGDHNKQPRHVAVRHKGIELHAISRRVNPVLPNGVQFCCAAYYDRHPWRSTWAPSSRACGGCSNCLLGVKRGTATSEDDAGRAGMPR